MIDARTGVRVNFTDTCDAKKIIGKAVGIKGDDLIDKLWPHMTAEQILQRSMYQEGTEQRSELKDLIESLLELSA